MNRRQAEELARLREGFDKAARDGQSAIAIKSLWERIKTENLALDPSLRMKLEGQEKVLRISFPWRPKPNIFCRNPKSAELKRCIRFDGTRILIAEEKGQRSEGWITFCPENNRFEVTMLELSFGKKLRRKQQKPYELRDADLSRLLRNIVSRPDIWEGIT